ncbi:MAG: anthranilate phosphoribosyltransferase [Coraliomargaritaceae bacterium]
MATISSTLGFEEKSKSLEKTNRHRVVFFLEEVIYDDCFNSSTVMDISSIIEHLEGGYDLSEEQATSSATSLADPNVEGELKKRFLLALAEKGETPVEVAAFASVFRQKAVDPGLGEWADQAIDIVGTGGDGAGTFNISTAVSFIVAACGVPVLKHGNRSITSNCGSADILEAVGVRLDAPHDVLQASVRELNFCFFFAPAFHPAFKEIMPVRKALAAEGKRTVFNLLGPLINPGRPNYQLMGVYAKDWVEPLAKALELLGLKSGLVVHGLPEPGQALDELSCSGTNHVSGFGALADVNGALSAKDAKLDPCSFSDLAGGDAAENLKRLHQLVSAEQCDVPKGLRDTILLNAGAALWIAGSEANLQDGIARADQALSSGQVADWLKRVRDFYQ